MTSWITSIGRNFAKVCALALTLLAVPALAQAPYVKLNVKGRVQLEVPDNWTINDAERRQKVRDLSEKLSGITIPHVAALSVQSYPMPSRVYVRVSFIPLETPFHQEDFLNLSPAERKEVLKYMTDEWQSESPKMWAALAKTGVRQVGQAKVYADNLGGKVALVIQYGRTLMENTSETMKVTQYHVPLGSEKALITLSYVDGDQTAISAHNRLKSSFVIR